jgi:hypothetical protein
MNRSLWEENMQRVGETAVIKRVLKATAPPTAAQEKFLAGCEIIQQAPLDGEPAFMARQLVQCTLPHSNPGDVPVWSRKNGNVSLSLQPGFDENDQCIGFPFGTLPRLLLFWMIREILRTNSRRLSLSGRDDNGKENSSLSAFMRELDLIPASAGGHGARRLKDQMRRLFNCRISFRVIEEKSDGHGERWLHMEVAPEGELWWDVKRPEQGSLWNSWIEVGEKFYQAVLQSPVPVDMRALRLLKTSALALDLYSWCVWKAFEARRTGRKQSIAWKILMRQLGCEYGGKDSEKTFKKNAGAALRRVKNAYPMLKIGKEIGGFSVLPSSGLAIVPRAARRKIEAPVTTT